MTDEEIKTDTERLRNAFPIFYEAGPREADSHTVAVNALLELALDSTIGPDARIDAALGVLATHTVPTNLLPILANKTKVSE